MRKLFVTFVNLLVVVAKGVFVGTLMDLREHPREEVADLLVDPQPADLVIGLVPHVVPIVSIGHVPVVVDEKASIGLTSISAG